MLLCGTAIRGRKLHQLILRGTSRKDGPLGVGGDINALTFLLISYIIELDTKTIKNLYQER